MEERRLFRGYCIQTVPKGETGSLALLLVPAGLLRVLVTGGNRVGGKAFPVNALTGTLAEFECGRRDPGAVWFMRSVKPLAPFGDFARDLGLSAFFVYAQEILVKFFQEDAAGIYAVYEKALGLLAAPKGCLPAAVLFTAFAIRCLGIQPEVTGCVDCGRAAPLVAFSFDEGGFMCRDCAAAMAKPAQPRLALLTYRYLFTVPLEKATPEKIDPAIQRDALREMVRYLVSYFGTEIASADLLFPTLG